MSIISNSKIKKLLEQHRQGVPFLSKWLVASGVSSQLQERYLKSGWLESIGHGAYKKFGDQITWLGSISALQNQASLPIHAGALTALSLLGREHYLRMGGHTSYSFSSTLRKLPAWFVNYSWGHDIHHVCTKFLPPKLGVSQYNEGHFKLQVSSLERAILECLYLAPAHIGYIECYQLLEGLVNLRPNVLQDLLEGCDSVRVKRIFLYMSHKANLSWLPFLDRHVIDLGKGVRSLEPNGVYSADFQLMVPKKLEEL